MSTGRWPREYGASKDLADNLRFLDGYLPYLLGRASHAMNKDFDRFVSEHGITPLEWRVLATLADHGPMSIGAIAPKVVAHQPTLTKAVNSMEESGLVVRAADADDLRKTVVRLEPKGLELARSLTNKARDHERELLRNFSRQEIRTIHNVIGSLLNRHSPKS